MMQELPVNGHVLAGKMPTKSALLDRVTKDYSCETKSA